MVNFFLASTGLPRFRGGVTVIRGDQNNQSTERFNSLGQAKIHNGGSTLGSSQLLLLPQLPQKTTLASKVVKNTQKNRLASLS